MFAARALQNGGADYALLESCPSLGGLTRTISVDDFCFDYTGHLLHLSRYESPSGIPFAGLSDNDWQRITRRSACLLGGQLVPAPVQYNLSSLPEPLRTECIRSYEDRPRSDGADPVSFRDYLIQGFGRKLSDEFLIPQNEKTWATSLDRLSRSAVKRFFPAPLDDRVRQGMMPGKSASDEYNSRFWYPRLGGIERLFTGVAASLTRAHALQPVQHVDLDRRTATTASGATWRWQHLLTSMPLKSFCERTNDADLVAAGRNLTHSSTVVFNLGIRGPIGDALRDTHWVYVPDRSLPFYRVGIYSNMTTGMAPPGCAALYVECGLAPEQLDKTHVATDLYPRVIRSLEELSWVRSADIACCVTHLIRCAYVHHTHDHADTVGWILDRLARHDVHPIGRYGTWDYISMEDSIHSAVECAGRLSL